MGERRRDLLLNRGRGLLLDDWEEALLPHIKTKDWAYLLSLILRKESQAFIGIGKASSSHESSFFDTNPFNVLKFRNKTPSRDISPLDPTLVKISSQAQGVSPSSL